MLAMLIAAYKTNPHERMRSQMYEHILGPAKIAHQTDTADQLNFENLSQYVVEIFIFCQALGFDGDNVKTFSRPHT